jgi:molybdopterin synthase catalytic subunit
MHVRVLFFGMLRDIVGRPEDQLELQEGSNLSSVFEHYARQFPRIREMADSIVLARNREFSDSQAAVGEGDEVALMPPVSGGAQQYVEQVSLDDGHFFGLTRQVIDTRKIIDRLLRGEDGAVVTFEGVVRNHTKGRRTRFLEYECYQTMAIRLMTQIGREIAASFPIDHIALVHRLGRLLVGETSVAVIVTAAHRRAAFDAALEGINRLKRTVPIWKKEYFADGEVWVEGEWDRDVPVAQSR